MKTSHRLLPLVAALLLPVAGGCGRETPPPVPPQPAAAARPETRPAEAAGAVGYNAKAVRSRVDNVLEQNDAHNRQVEKAIGE